MKPYYQDKWVTIYHGDCREILPVLDKASAIVTDPPYELGFMGKSWDSKGVSFQVDTWKAVRQSCLSGAMMLSFGGTRTFHRIAVAIEDAGWEIRDTVMWIYGSGFPKSENISIALDKKACREQLTKRLGRPPTKEEFKAEWEKFREVIGVKAGHEGFANRGNMSSVQSLKGTLGGEGGFARPWMDDPETVERYHQATSPTTPEAQLWNGYGTALKPAYEPILVCMNPLDGTFAQNALKYGVAGLNIDECRVETDEDQRRPSSGGNNGLLGTSTFKIHERRIEDQIKYQGRFPANIIHDGSQYVMELFPETHAPCSSGGGTTFGSKKIQDVVKSRTQSYIDNGSAARFFYCAKASKAERNKGCEELEEQSVSYMNTHGGNADKGETWHPIDDRTGIERDRFSAKMRNSHPTVKPLALMEYLVKLVKMPEYNLIIDPFMGSGSTLLACIRQGIQCTGIDNDEKSCEIAAKRCSQEVMELGL